ncbi:MAG TPA: phosphotransferase family protein, partial [Acidimicrobiales bacterium]|nr:phosphotransferase family protein [Acidimicrobiales bacterium]
SADPCSQGSALEQLIDVLVAIHDVAWEACGLGDLAPAKDYLARQRTRWLSQLDSYAGRDLPAARVVGDWLDAHRPNDQRGVLCHGDYKLDNVLFAPDLPPRLLAVVDWEMAAIGDPFIDVAWALIFHPGPEGTMRLGMTKEPRFDVSQLPSRDALIERYAKASGRDSTALGWYDVFARWKLAIVLEGSYAKFLRGGSSKPVHEQFGAQVDLLLGSAMALIEQRALR